MDLAVDTNGNKLTHAPSISMSSNAVGVCLAIVVCDDDDDDDDDDDNDTDLDVSNVEVVANDRPLLVPFVNTFIIIMSFSLHLLISTALAS
jgi:hypothetical protein